MLKTASLNASMRPDSKRSAIWLVFGPGGAVLSRLGRARPEPALSLAMVLASVRDPDGRVVDLTLERWAHIVVNHPELKAYRAEVIGAVERPYARLAGQRDNESWYVVKTQAPSRWLRVVVAYEGERGWIVTAFARRRMP